MKVSVTKRILLVLMCLIMLFSIAACSERKPDELEQYKAGEKDTTATDIFETIDAKKARSEIAETIRNKSLVKKTSGDEWIHIDILFRFYFKDYLVTPNKETEYGVTIKGNINMLNNDASQFFLEARDIESGKLDFGLYYYQSVGYLVVGDEKFYLTELNITELALTLVDVFSSIGLDPTTLVSGIVSGDTGIEAVDKILKSVGTLLWESNFKQQIINDGQTQIISAPLKLNWILSNIPLITGMIGIDISWEGFGLPDMDRLLDQILGFGLHTIFEKKWPIMNANINAISTLQLTDNDEEVFVSDGFSITIDTPIVIDEASPRRSQLHKEFDLAIEVSPMRIGAEGGMVPIDFSRTPLGQENFGTVYKKGSLLNLETGLSFSVENEKNTSITLNDILGEGLLDLGAVGEIPLKMPTATKYEFDLDIKVGLDFFDNTLNRGEVLLTFQGEQFVRGYLMGDTLYLDLSALTDKYGRIIPDIKLSDIDITGTLFDSDIIVSLFDPTYSRDILSPTNIQNEEEEEASDLDIMAILEIILREDVLYLPGHKSGGNFVLSINNDVLNEIIGMFLPGANLGLKGITIESGTSSIADLITKLDLMIEVSDDLRANLKINKLSIMREPAFDFSAIDTVAKRESFVDVKDVTEFNLYLAGDFTLGLASTQDGISVNLDGVIAGLTQKLLVDIGVTVDTELKFEYELNANVDANDLGKTELTLIIYISEGASGLREKILHIYYVGQDDTIFVDLSLLHNLEYGIPMLAVLGSLPKFYVEDVGLSALLSGLLDGTPEVETDVEMTLNHLAQNGINFEEEDDGVDPLQIIGSILGDILIDNYKINVFLNENMLTALMGLLDVDIEMPKVNILASLGIYKVDDGYVNVHIGLQDASGPDLEPISIYFCIIRQVAMLIGRRDIASDFDVTSFVSLDKLMENLNIAVELEGMLAIDTKKDYYTNDLIDSLLSDLIQDLALKLNLQEFKMYIGYTIRGNINVNDILDSEIEIILYDNENKVLNKEDPRLLSIYMKDRNLYLDLSYFGLPRLGLTNIEALTEGLLNAHSLNQPSNSFTDLLLQNQEAEDSIKIQLLINPTGLATSLSGELIGALLIALGLDLPISFNYLDLEINTTANPGIYLGVGVEGFDVSFGMGGFYISFNASERHTIEVPDLDKYNMTDMGLPMGIYAEIQGYLYFTNSEAYRADLSPILAYFLGDPESPLGDIDLNVYLDFLGIENEKVYYDIKAYINLLDIESSRVSFALRSEPQGETILYVYYESGDLYLNTGIFGIGKVLLKDVGNIFSSISLAEEYGTEFLNEEEVYPVKTFLDLIFFEGGLGVSITKDVLLAIFTMLGLDLNGMFDELEFGAGVAISIDPLDIDAHVEFGTAKFGLRLNGLDIKWQYEGLIEPPADINNYEVITELKKLGIELGGEFTLDIFGNSDGERGGVRMDKILRELGMDIDVGLLFQVIGNTFGGTVYYKIKANLDLSNIANIQLALYLSTSLNEEDLGDILSLFVLGQPNGAINIYLDASALGLEKIKIIDVAQMVGTLMPSGITPLAVDGNINNAERGSTALLPDIIVRISMVRELQDSLLAINVTTGAIFSLLATLADIDLSTILDGFGPSLDVNLLGDGYLCQVAVTVENLLRIDLQIYEPKISLNPANIYIVGEGDYTEISDECTVKVTFGGEINLAAYPTDSSTEIDLSDLIFEFLETTDFGVIIKNLVELKTTLYYDVEASISIKEVISNNLAQAFKLKFTITDSNGLLLIAAYLDEGTIYIDLSALNIGKVKIEDAFSLFGLISEEDAENIANDVRLLNETQNPSEALFTAFITMQLSNKDGLFIQVVRNTVRVLFNSLGLPGDLIDSTVHGIEAIASINNEGLAVNLSVAQYEFELKFNKLGINIKDHEIDININKDSYASLNELPNEIYASLNITFNLDMSAGAEYDLSELLSTLIAGGSIGFDIRPVLRILEEISTEYLLNVEAMIKINDILTSDIKLTLYAVGAEGSLTPVLHLYYLGGTIYLDAEVFNIQKLRIVDGIDFFQNLFVTNNPMPLGNMAPIEGSNQAGALASIINVTLSEEGLVTRIGISALFAILGAVGGISTDAADLINSVGDLGINLSLLGPKVLAQIDIQLWAPDGTGQPKEGYGIVFGIKIGYDFQVNFAPEQKYLSVPLDYASYIEIKEIAPIISVATTIEFNLKAAKKELNDIYGEPLSGLINSLITDLIFQIALNIEDDQAAKIVLDIKAEFNPLDFQSLVLQIEVKKDNKLYARVSVMSGNLYIDLSFMGGSRMKMADVIGLIMPSDAIDNSIANQEENNEEEINLPALSILAQIQANGLFIFAEKQVFDILFSMLGLNEFDMMNNLHAVVSIVPNADIKSVVIGAEIGLGDSTESDVFTLGVAINGLRVNFVRFGSELIKVNSTKFVDINNINMIKLQTRLEFSLATAAGTFEFKNLLAQLFDSEELFGRALAPQLEIAQEIGDTIVMDITLLIPLEDILEGMQVRAHVFSKSSDAFDLELVFWNNNLYLDGTKIGLSKIYGKNIPNAIAGLIASDEDEDEEEPMSVEMYYMAWQELLNSDDPLVSDTAKVTFILSQLNGLTIQVSTGMLITALGLAGVDLTPYLDGLIKPSVDVNISPVIDFKIGINLPSATSDGSINLGLALIGQSTNFDTLYEVVVETISGPVTNVPPLISAAEREEYTDYSDMELYLAFSVVVELGLDDGRLDLSQLLHILADGFNMGLDIREAHTLRLNVDIELGVAINKLISRDEIDIDESVRLKGKIHYTIIDDSGGEFHSQTILNIFNYDRELYISVEVFGTTIKLKVSDFSIGALINDLIDLSSFTEAYEEDRENPNNAERLLYNNGGVSNDLIVDLILNKQGIAVLITAELINSIEMLVSSEELDLSGAIKAIVDEGKVGLFFDDGMYVGLNLSKKGDASINAAGYNLNILLLDGMVFDTNGKNEQKLYYHFFNSFQQDIESGMFNDYFYFDEISDRVTVGLQIELSADLIRTMLDWSDLFDVQEIPTKFILEFLSDMHGTIIVDILADIHITGIAQLGIEAQLLLKNTSGEVLLGLYYVGNLNKMAENFDQAALYLECAPLGIPKLMIGYYTLIDFLDFDIATLFGYEDEEEENGPQNAEGGGLLDDVLGDIGIDITKLFDSISIAKGNIGIVVAHNFIAALLQDAFGWNFADIGALELSLDMIDDEIAINLALDVERKVAFRIALNSFYVHLGVNNIFEGKDFSVYRDLNEYKFETVVESSLTVNDKLFSVFDMKALTAPLLNDIGIVLQAGDNLDMQLDFLLKIYIDFSNFNFLKLELEVKLYDKVMARIIYVGEKENGTIYLQLEGLGLPNMKLDGINLGALVKGLISNMGEEENGEIINNAAPNIFNAEGDDDLSKLQSLLHFILDYEEVTLAITGALAASLLSSVADGMTFPEFDRLKVGYNKKDNLAGLLLILTQNGSTLEESFRIKYNFNDMRFNFATNAKSSIDYSKDSLGKTIVYQDISVIRKVGLTLDAEIILKTRKPTDEKSPTITGLENLVAGLVGVPASAIDLDLQDSYMVYGISLGLIVDLGNLSNTKLSLDVTYNMRPLLSVYYVGETNGVYADLSGLGLFKASISGLDLMSLVGDLLSGFELIKPDEGLDLGGLLGGLLNAEGDAIKRLPTIKIVLNNKSIAILPNIEVIAALAPDIGAMLPPISLIAAEMNFYAGLNNASIQVKLDTVGNDVLINVPEGGLRLGIGNITDNFTYIPSATALSKFGGVAGINLNANGMAMDTLGLVNSIYDSLNLKRFVIYIEKRNNYWQRRDFNEAFKVSENYGVRVKPNSTDGFFDWGNYTGNNGYNRTKLMINRKSNNMLEVDFWQIDNQAASAGVFITNSGLHLKLGTSLKIAGIAISSLVDDLGVMPSLLDIVMDELLGDDGDVELTAVYGHAFGYVIDDITLEPVQGAKVVASLSGKEYTTYTNKDGAYAFLNLRVGNGYRLTITCPEQFYQQDNSTTFNIRNVESYDSTVIATKRLVRQDTAIYDNVRFHGRVLNHLGEPAVGVDIYVSKQEKTGFFYIGTTDEEGYYDCEANGLVGSKHNVMIGASSGVIFELGEDQFYVITQTGERVDGFDVSRNYNLVLYDLYTNITFKGIVKDYFGTPIPDTLVRLRDEVKGTTITTYSDSSGHYTITIEAIQGLYHSIRAEKNGYHTMAYIKKTVNANNQVITQDLILNKIRDVEYKGVITDDFGNPVFGANIFIDNTLVTQTNEHGQYSFVQNVNGLSKKIRAEKTGYFQPEDISKTIDGGTSEVVTNMTLYSVKNIVFSGVVRDGNGAPLSNAQFYYNGVVVAQTNAYGAYSYTYNMPTSTIKEKDFKLEHTLKVSRDGYFNIDAVNVVTYKETGAVSRDFVLRVIDSGKIIGKLVDEKGNPITRDVYIYFQINGKTVIEPDTYGLEPVDFALQNYTTGQSQIGIDSGGNISLVGAPLNVNIVLKFRSKKYENKNIALTRQLGNESTSNTIDIGTIELVTKPTHWSQMDSELDMSMIARIRIRLGADIRDAAYHNNDIPSNNTTVYNNLNKGIETGAADIYDDITYIELWLDPMFINDLFNMIHNLMMGMMAIMPITPDSVTMPHDLIKDQHVQMENGIAIGQTYVEDDMELYEYKYDSYADYLATYKNGINKIPSGIIGWGIGMALESMDAWIRTLIGLAQHLIPGLLRQATAILAHLVPFQDAYSMIQTQGMIGNPLSEYSELLDPGDEDGFEVGSPDGPRTIKRKIDYFDLGVYAKVTMNTSDPYNNTIQRISLLLNGATYVNQGDNSELDGAGNFAPRATDVRKMNIVYNERFVGDNQAYMQNWIKYSVVNSYIIVNEYDADDESILVNQYFIYDNYGHQIYDSGRSIKDDAYQEIDIDNNGIGLRVAKAIPDSFVKFSSTKEEAYNPPTEIIFNDPYDTSDFTFVGGTWAYESPNHTRTNTDPEKTVLDFLPNRVYITFLDGNSDANNGVAVIWDMTAIKFTPEGTDPSNPKDVYYLKGYALNQTYGKNGTEYTKIKCTIKPRLVDPTKVAELRDLPEIDPLSFNEAEYLAKLPKMFHYDFDTSKGGYSYVFTQLDWDLSKTDFNYDSIQVNIKLTYSFPGVLPATIDVPVKVKNRSIININTLVPGSYNGIGIIRDTEIIDNAEVGFFRVAFDPFENTNPQDSLKALSHLSVQTEAEAAFVSWKIEAMDLSELDGYDPREYVQGPYNVYFWLADDFGKTQKITVRVIINSKEIVETSLQDQEFVPYGYQNGEPNKLELPDNVTVYYADGTHQIIPVPANAWNVPKMSSTFTDGEDDLQGTGKIKKYRVTTILGIGESGQEVGFTVTVHHRKLLSLEPLELDSIEDVMLPARQMVKFSNGNSEIFEEVDILWAIGQEHISSSFTGATYYSNVTISDSLFESQTLRNVRITVSQTSINALLLPEDVHPENKDIIPFTATNNINELFAKEGFKIDVEGLGQTTLDQSKFDIISWRYVDSGGINLDGSQSYIIVKLGNKNYGEGNKIWTQEVFVDLSDYVRDVSSASINNTLEIDPSDYALPDALKVTLGDGSFIEGIPCSYDLSSVIATLFSTSGAEINKGITIGSGNNKLQFTLHIVNTSPRAVSGIDYGIDFENTEIFAFDTTFTLPLVAQVTFAVEGGTDTLSLPIEWLSIGDFGEQGGKIIGSNKIGTNTFGYIYDNVEIRIAPELMLSTSLPDTIIIDPYGATLTEQLLAQGLNLNNILVVTEEAGEQSPRVMNAPMPNINITYKGNDEGELINFMVGLSWHLNKRVEKAIPVNVIVEERIAVGVMETFEGTIYQQVDFEAYNSLTVLFQNGVQKQLPITGWDTSNLRYTLIGGRYTVEAFFGTGKVAQSVDVEVVIKPSKLLTIGEMEMVGSQWTYKSIDRLIVDPYEGFVDLPSTVYATFQHADSPIEIKVDWAYSHIARVMSVNGKGNGLNADYEGNMAAVATVYMEGTQGKTALQSIEIPVTVLNKEIETIYVSKSGNGDDYIEYSDNVFIDPYAGPYNEKFDNAAFSYYRKVKLVLKDNDEKEFDLTASSYRIFDNDTKVATNLNNLYTGRTVIVNMTFGASGGSIALDAMSTRTITTTIYNMTYASGLPKDEYNIDVYGVRQGFDTEASFEQGQVYAVQGANNSGITRSFAMTYDDKHINTQFKAGLPVRVGQAINFNEGEGRLYATYGNEYGGYQTVSIPVYYLNRVASSLFDTTITPYYGVLEEGGEREGFTIDPFAFSKDTFIDVFPTSGKAKFSDEYGDIDKVLSIEWDNNKARNIFSIKGGITQVYATIGSGANAQRIEFFIKVLNRRVVNSTENESIVGVIKTSAYQSGGVLASGKLKPYRYLQATDVPTAINSDLFASGTAFTVHTVEGAPITYTYNANPTNQGGLIVSSDEQNLRMVMQMDTGMSLSHRGGYLRFYLTMPGYASGKDGQQQVPLYIPMQEQYIKEIVKADGTAIGWDEGGNLTNIDSKTWKINNPYYFITRTEGLKLPDSVIIKTGVSDSAGIEDEYLIKDVRWNNSSRNKLNINYDDELIQAAFSIDLDGQSYHLTFECVPYILSNTLLFSSSSSYGIDEFISLPDNNLRHNNAKDIIQVDSNGNYNITFNNGAYQFTNINGGGSRFTFNKWDFTDVWFDNEAPKQEATLRLGGMGGQIIRWEFNTSSKVTINYSIQTLYVTEASSSFYFPSDGDTTALPSVIRQYFSNDTYKDFAVEYNQIIDGESEYAINFNATTRQVTPRMKSPGRSDDIPESTIPFPAPQPESVAKVGQIMWSPTSIRAYPSTEDEVGEILFFSVYEDKEAGNKNSTRPTYLRHPDDTIYKYDEAPGVDVVDYKYIEGIYTLDGYTSECYFSPGTSAIQTSVPTLLVKKGTRIDFRNLPLYDVYNEFTSGLTTHKQTFTYYMPWSTGQVRYLPAYQANSWDYTGNEDDFGTEKAVYAINTNEVGAVYTISTSVTFGSNIYRMHCKIMIVDSVN